MADSRAPENAPHYELRKKDRRKIAERTCEDRSGRGVPVESAVRRGVPHDAILQYAADQDVDLVVMGTHGRSGVERYLPGSVAEKTVRASPSPVMTARQPA